METTPRNKMVTASPKNKVTKPAKGKGVKENKKDKSEQESVEWSSNPARISEYGKHGYQRYESEDTDSLV